MHEQIVAWWSDTRSGPYNLQKARFHRCPEDRRPYLVFPNRTQLPNVRVLRRLFLWLYYDVFAMPAAVFAAFRSLPFVALRRLRQVPESLRAREVLSVLKEFCASESKRSC